MTGSDLERADGVQGRQASAGRRAQEGHGRVFLRLPRRRPGLFCKQLWRIMTHAHSEYRRNPMSFIVPALPLRGASLPNLSLSERAFRAVLTVELWMDRSSQRRALRELPECVMHDLAL